MAARRLLIVMLVLLGVATLLAALVGDRTLREEGTSSTIASETTQTETETVPTDTIPAGVLRTEAIEVGRGKPEVVRMEVGEQLELIVSAEKADQLEIPALGLLQPVLPDAPARFDILGTAVENYGMRLVRADRVVARIEVSKAPTEPEPGA
jgi:hypothetical protein